MSSTLRFLPSLPRVWFTSTHQHPPDLINLIMPLLRPVLSSSFRPSFLSNLELLRQAPSSSFGLLLRSASSSPPPSQSFLPSASPSASSPPKDDAPMGRESRRRKPPVSITVTLVVLSAPLSLPSLLLAISPLTSLSLFVRAAPPSLTTTATPIISCPVLSLTLQPTRHRQKPPLLTSLGRTPPASLPPLACESCPPTTRARC